jgi:hypothetical protein
MAKNILGTYYWELSTDPSVTFDDIDDVRKYIRQNSITDRIVFNRVEILIVNADPSDYGLKRK